MKSDQVKRNNLLIILATWFGCGFSPIAPGTIGSLGAVPLLWISIPWPFHWRIFLWLGLFFFGTLAAKHFNQIHQSLDHQSIVVDEVLGMGIASAFAQRSLTHVMIIFLFFRFFDILKLPPVRFIDRWSKTKAGFGGAMGVMLDDVFAGIQALLLFWILSSFMEIPAYP